MRKRNRVRRLRKRLRALLKKGWLLREQVQQELEPHLNISGDKLKMVLRQ